MTPRTATRQDDAPATAARTRRERTSSIGASLRAAWDNGDKALQYTLIAVTTIALAGAIIIPMAMPDGGAPQDRASLLAERYIASLPADAAKPALQKVVADFGSTGGEACTAKTVDTYKSHYVKFKRKGGKTGTRLDRAGLADTTLMMETYCPSQAEALQQHADQRAGTSNTKGTTKAAG